MNKTVLKIFAIFVLLSAATTTVMLVINVLGISFIGSDPDNVYPNTPRHTLKLISENINISKDGISLSDTGVISKDRWCILLDENGDMIWSHNKPEEIPEHYSINDIARLTRWFLKDYPVYVRTEDYGLFILGLPKNSVGKYDVQYSMDWFVALPRRMLILFLLNLGLGAALACIFGTGLYRRLKSLTAAVSDLKREKSVHLKEKGIFREVIQSINETSAAIERKNAVLAQRDSARANWIAGISHDIRTPLSLVTGYSEVLAASPELSEDNRKKAGIITSQSLKIKKLMDDLCLSSSLEYDMQPSRKKEVRLCPLIRRTAAEIINSGLDEKYTIDLELRQEQAVVMGDEGLLERALFNLINNSITHNTHGCDISILEFTDNGRAYIIISDNGSGVDPAVLENIQIMPGSEHGLGLPMAYKIFHVHGGNMWAENKDNGFLVKIELPLK